MESVTSGRKAADRFAGGMWLTASLLGLSAPVMAQQGSGLDFRLPPADDGRDSNVQGPSDNGLPPVNSRQAEPPKAPPPAPKIVPPAPKASQPAPLPAPAPKVAEPKAPAPKAAQPSAPAPKVAQPSAPAPAPSGGLMDTDLITPPSQEPLPLPMPEAAPSEDPVAVPEVGVEDVAAAPAEEAETAQSSTDMPWWAWALAAALGLGAGLIYWRRQARTEDEEDESAAEAPPAAPPAKVEPVRKPVVPAAPAPKTPTAPEAPAPVRPPVLNQDRPVDARGGVTAPVPAAPATPSAPPSPQAAMGYVQAKPLVRRAAAEVRADVAMDVAVRSIRVEQDHVAVGFLLTLSNRGSLAATGLMVRIALGQGAAMNEDVLGRFYDGAGGSVLRDDIDLPAGRSEQLSSEVKLPRSAIDPLMMGGQPMLVPVLAADVTYHWEGPGDAFGQIAAAYVLGRASVGGSEKLSPVSLAQTPVAVDRPAARMTAIGRRQ